MLLFIDNYDSFTYNIVQYFAQLGQEVCVRCNDQIGLDEIEAVQPQYIVIGPGPCSPKEAGISVSVLRHFAGKIPMLGICLGHQAIAEAFGGKVVRAKTLMHGKTSPVFHHNSGVFHQLPSPVVVTRYHSLAIERESLPEHLLITAWTEDQEIMGIKHRDFAIEGVQFHPEGLLTEYGHEMLRNFLIQHQTIQAA